MSDLVHPRGTDQPEIGSTPSPPDTSKWSWWWSTDQERYNGPHGSREQAIVDAWADPGATSFHVMRAVEGQYRCDLYDPADLAEQFDEINYELGDGDGDGPSASMPKDVWKHIAATIKQQVRLAVLKHCPTSWAFNGQTEGEWIDLSQPRLAALPEEARSIISDLAVGYSQEHGYAPSYVEREMARLKVVLAPAVEAAGDQDEGAGQASGRNT